MEILRKTLFWIFCTLFFGLFQIFIVFFASIFTDQIAFSLPKVIDQGVILFFSIALVGAITTDFYLENEVELGRITTAYLTFLYPAIILCSSVLLYMVLFLTEQYESELVQSAQVTILGIILLHTTSTKGLLYYQNN